MQVPEQGHRHRCEAPMTWMMIFLFNQLFIKNFQHSALAFC
jgi:hypothetical protein